jgi:large subunit ribosomal protein L10
MKKLGLLFKEISGTRIKSNLEASDSVFIIKYSGLSGPDLSNLRLSLGGINANLFVVRNKVATRVLKDTKWDLLNRLVDGPCGIIFIKDDPIGASKLLCAFSKEHEKLKLEGGLLQDKFLEKKDIEALAKIASKEVLRAQVVMVLKSPINGLVFALSGLLKKLVICLDQIKNKKTS